MDFGEVTTMKQITNKEYEEWQKYKAEKAKGHVLLPDTVRFICEANGSGAESGSGARRLSNNLVEFRRARRCAPRGSPSRHSRFGLR